MNYWSNDGSIIRKWVGYISILLPTSGLSFKSLLLSLASLECMIFKFFFYIGSKLPNSQLHNGQPDPRFMGLCSVLFIFHKIATLYPASLIFHKIARWFLITIELLSLHLLSCRRWVSPSLWWSQRQASCSVPYVGDCLSVSHHHPWAHTLWWSLLTFWRNWSSLGQLTCSQE